MSEEKSKGALEKHGHTFALGGRAIAAVSILLLVPFVRRLRAQRAERHHHRRLLFGH
jgi:hypothetical protein